MTLQKQRGGTLALRLSNWPAEVIRPLSKSYLRFEKKNFRKVMLRIVAFTPRGAKVGSWPLPKFPLDWGNIVMM